MARIGIFGGTFNPIHNGHLLAIAEFRRRLELDRVLVIPACVPPHKALPPRSADAQARLEMVQAAVAGMEGVEVSDMELRRSGPSYTADTLRQLKAQFSGDTLFLLVGTDSYLTLEQWYQPEVVLSLATVVCAHRNEDDPAQLCAQQAHLLERYQAETMIIANEFLEISSSDVRRMITFGCGESYVTREVAERIRQWGLYGSGENWKDLPFEELKAVSLSLTKKKRMPHVVGCCQTAVELAQQYGENPVIAARAGILHDVTKALNEQEQLKLCEKYDIVLNETERKNASLLHAKTGAAVAKFVFGECDEVCQAIWWHTTGHPGMTQMEKILYIADYIEPNRDFDGVETLRALARQSLDAAMLKGLEMTLEVLKQRGKEIDPDSLAAWEMFLLNSH